MSCIVCKVASRVEGSPKLSDVETAFISGLALGFVIRYDVTLLETCPEHGQLLKQALRSAGATDIPVVRGGSA